VASSNPSENAQPWSLRIAHRELDLSLSVERAPAATVPERWKLDVSGGEHPENQTLWCASMRFASIAVASFAVTMA